MEMHMNHIRTVYETYDFHDAKVRKKHEQRGKNTKVLRFVYNHYDSIYYFLIYSLQVGVISIFLVLLH